MLKELTKELTTELKTEFKSELKQASIILLILSLILGLLYPLLITIIAQFFFPFQANGSIVDDKGSILIGQIITEDFYFQGRSSRGALSPSDPMLLEFVNSEITEWQKNNSKSPVPIDLITASASQLDPDISPQAAYFQAERVANKRHVRREKIEQLIQAHIQHRTLGILGEPRVNVFLLNQDLDKMYPNKI